MKLREIAHARAGDKGDVSNISVIAYELGDYAYLVENLTAERVKAYFGETVRGSVVRYMLPGLGALNFVMEEALGGGVTRTLSLDVHGKSLSFSLLDIDMPDQRPANIQRMAAAPPEL
jgi:hypothetical protein